MKKTILIVDDDEDDRDLFCEAAQIANPNICCEKAKNGEEALRILADLNRRLPDYIFLDLNMPRFNGKQCLAEIRRNDRLNQVPVIIYSTTKHNDDVRETLELGASHFIIKPALFREISHSI